MHIKSDYFRIGYCIIVVLAIGCQKAVSPPPSTGSPSAPSDTTSTKQTTPATPVDTVMTIYVGKGTGLYAVNAQTGAIKWSTDLGDLVGNSPLYYQGMVYVSTSLQSGLILHAVDTAGKQQWTVNFNTSIDVGPSDVYAANGMLYLCSQFTPPVAVDAQTGAIRWTFPAAQLNPLGSGGGTICWNQGILFFLDAAELYSIDPASGQVNWTINDEATTLPAFTGNKVILGWQNGAIEAVNPHTAAVIWQQPETGYYPSVESISMNTAFGNVYMYEGGSMPVYDTTNGTVKFNTFAPGDALTPVHCTDSLLFVSSPEGNVTCLNALTGAQKFSFTMSSTAPLITTYALSGTSALNNVFYFNYDYLYAKSISTQQTIWKTMLENNDGWSYSTPCIVTKSGKVYRGGNTF